MALTKIQGGVVKNTTQLSINSINATGIITATTFFGNFTGTASTATGLSGTPDITVGIITATNVVIGGGTTQLVVTGNARVTGVVTATTFVGNLTGTASTASFATTSFGLSGNPSISVTGVNASGITTVSAGSAAAPSISPSGDSNTGIFFSAADTINASTGGTSRITIDSNGNITLTNNFYVPLGSAAAPSISFTGDTNTGIYSPGADQVAISTGGSGRLTIDSSGNINIDSGTVYVDAVNNRLGIGTSSVNANLHIAKNTNGTCTTLRISGNDGAGDGGAGLLFADNEVVKWSIFTRRYSSNNRLYISTAENDTNSSKVTITEGGLLGIGTTSPENLLTVSTNTDGTSSLLKLHADADGVNNGLAGIKFSGNAGNHAAYIYGGHSTAGNTFLSFYTDVYPGSHNPQEKMRLDANGRLLVGTTSGSYQLQLSSDSAGKPSTNTWTIVSDERIKEEIELADLDLCYEAVKNIPLKRFKWKDKVYTEEQVHDRRKLGWIAQDVETVFPKAVHQHKFKYNQVFKEVVIPAVPAELDADGSVITKEQPERIEKGELISEEVIEDCRDLNSDQLYAAMYGAVQKLIAKVETLEAEITALKGSGPLH
jgi:hypothetical protein